MWHVNLSLVHSLIFNKLIHRITKNVSKEANLPFHEVIILLSKCGRGLFFRASYNMFFAIFSSFFTFSTVIPNFLAVFSLLLNSINTF